MDPLTIRLESPLEALVVEQALAMAREMQAQAEAAADGQVLNVCESLVLQRGRELMRLSLEAALNAQAQRVEKRGPRREPVPAANPCGTRAARRGRS